VTGAPAVPGRPSRRGRLGLAAAVLAAGFLAWALVRGWSGVTAYDWDADWPLLALAAAVLAVFYLASGCGYLLVLESVSTRRPPRRAMLAVWGLSLLGRYVPGSVVMIAGRIELGRDRGVARRTGAAALVYEQALTLCVAAGFGLAFVLVYGGIGPAWVSGAVALVPLGLLLLHPRVMGWASRRVLARFGRPPLERLVPGRRIVVLALWFAGTAVLAALGTWLVVRGLAGPEAGSAPYVGGAFLFAVALSMLTVVVPSGLGVREGALALALAQNVPGGVAVALSVASRLALTLVEIVVVAVLVLVARRS
jgi:uncharacterized membrane protein YbhN (UPF0104 family)